VPDTVPEFLTKKAAALFCALLPVLAAHGSAQNLVPSKPLLDPSVAKLADGIERFNANLQAPETYLPVLYPSSHAANLYELKNGDILCVWFSGTWEGSSGVGIVISRRPNGSRNWAPPVLIDQQAGASFQNPVLFQEPDGTIDLYHSTQQADAGEANAHVLHLVSKDNGITWTKPTLLFAKPGAFTRHPIVILPDGSWLLPLTYIATSATGTGSEANYSATEISRDHGAIWKECLMAGSQGKIQPSVISLAPGRLLAFFRSRARDFIYSSTSSDGCTWTPAAATVLPNNDASIQAFRLHNGHLVMAFNNSSNNSASGALRKPLSVALSLDDGKTWPYLKNLEAGRPGYGLAEQTPKQPGREEYSYPSIIQTHNGEILVAFTWRRQTIKIVSITEDWIMQKSTAVESTGIR
jgi:predicted neuraminidase